MTEKEIRRLNREALLELLLLRTEENEALQARLAELQAQLEEAQGAPEAAVQAHAESVEVVCAEGQITEAGTFAEAAVRISGVFEAAEQAAKVYLENIQRMQAEKESACAAMLDEHRRKCEQMDAEARASAEALVADARRKAQENLAESERRCSEMESEARQRCDEMLAEAQQDPSRRLFELSNRVDQIIRENAELRSMIAEQPAKKRKWHL